MQMVNAGDSNPTLISEINWSHDRSKLAVAYSDGSFRILQTSDMSTLFHQSNSDNYIGSFGWSDSGTKLAIGYSNERVDIWDVVNFQKNLTLLTGENRSVALTWWDNENVLFVGDGGELPTLKFDANTGVLLNTYYPIYSNFYPLSNNIISINLWFDKIMFVDLVSMTIIDEYAFDEEFGRITSLRVSPDEETVAIGFFENTIRILDLQSREIIAVLDGGQVIEGERGIIDLAFNETGTRLFTITRMGMIRSWDTNIWQMIDSVELDTVIISSDFSPDVNQITYSDIEQAPQLLMLDLCDFVAPDGASLENILPQANVFNEEAQICLTENGQYDLTAPLPTITGDITIIGNGAQITMIGEGQIFSVGEFGNLTLKNVIISGGDGIQGKVIDEANSSR
jgi:WD40 repeat protein